MFWTEFISRHNFNVNEQLSVRDFNTILKIVDKVEKNERKEDNEDNDNENESLDLDQIKNTIKYIRNCIF